MPIRRPEDIHPAFADAMRSLDLERVVSVYEDQAVLLLQPGSILRGHAAIREGLGAFLVQKPELTLEESTVIDAGDVALLHSRWAIKIRNADGSETSFHVRPTQVARRQPDGTWRVAIDEPSTDT